MVERSFSVERIRVDQSPWIPKVTTLIAASLGPGYLTEADLESAIAKSDSAVFVARRRASLLGTASAVIADNDARARLQGSLGRLGVVDSIAARDRVGLFRAMAVEPTERGHGIGDALVKARLAFLLEAGCTVVYVASWVWGPRHQSAGLLRRNGFEPLGQLSFFWSDAAGASAPCIVCGRSCHCAAVLMRRACNP